MSHTGDQISNRADGLLTFDQVYEKSFNFVWRNARRLGVPEGAVDDAVQDVFLVVYRRLSDFEGRSRIDTWLFGILLRVVKDHRRSSARRRARLEDAESLSKVADPGHAHSGPHDELARNQAVRTLYALLDRLDDDKRAILVAVDLEQLSVTDAAVALSLNLNTAYARLRSARRTFEQLVSQVQLEAKEKVSS